MKISKAFYARATASLSYLAGSPQGLAVTFNTRPSKPSVFSRRNGKQGLFGVPELATPEGFYTLEERVLADTDRLIGESVSPDRRRRMVEVFDELSDTLCRLADLAEFIRIAHPDRRFAEAAEHSCLKINALVERLNTHVELYSSLKRATEQCDVLPLSHVDKHVGRLFLFDFEQSGIHLPDVARQKIVQLNDRILQLGQRFSIRSHEPRRIPRNLFPAALRQYFPAAGTDIVVSSLYAESSDETLREAAYRMYLLPDKGQDAILEELLATRHELANLCGFPTFSERALKNSVAGSSALVDDFLKVLRGELASRASKDYDVMRNLKRKQMAIRNELYPWDPPYLSGVLKREIQGVRSSQLAPFFSIGNCMEGINQIFKSIFDISLETCEAEIGELWHSDVYKLGVVHATEGLLGYIYCDFFERPGKPNQDCHFTIVGGRTLSDGSYQNPVVVLMLNLPAPSWGTPSLLTPGMVENLFHEMGHAMHSMLARTRYQHVTGTRCSTDLAEVPSVLMEFFASDPRVLGQFARHYKTGETLSDEKLNAVCAAKYAFTASETQLQTFYAALDQKYHGKYPLGASTTEVLKDMQNEYYALPYVPNTAWQLRFGHLFGYGAKYYSYLMSRAVASWLWHDLFHDDPFSRDSGEKYRAGVLTHGGGIPPREILCNFLKQEVSAKSLVNSLVGEIDSRREKLQEVWR